MLRDCIDRVEQRIQDALRRAGRARSEVTLVAVTKKFSAGVMREAYALEPCVFGENCVQGFAAKHVTLADVTRGWEPILHFARAHYPSVWLKYPDA